MVRVAPLMFTGRRSPSAWIHQCTSRAMGWIAFGVGALLALRRDFAPAGGVCLSLQRAGSRPGCRVTFFCWHRRKSPKKSARTPAIWPACFGYTPTSSALAREHQPNYGLGFLAQVQTYGIAAPRPFGSSVWLFVPEPLRFASGRSVTAKWLVFRASFLVTFSGPAEKSDPPAGAESRRGLTEEKPTARQQEAPYSPTNPLRIA